MYNRQKAVEYAKEWWNKRNPNFFNFDNLGGDCTNFISQCLYYGNINMTQSWHYISLQDRTPSWTGVNELFKYLTSNQKENGIKAKQIKIDEIEIGDIVQLQQFGKKQFHHSLIVSKIEKGKIYVSCHTNNAFNKPLDDYYYEKIRFIKITN